MPRKHSIVPAILLGFLSFILAATIGFVGGNLAAGSGTFDLIALLQRNLPTDWPGANNSGGGSSQSALTDFTNRLDEVTSILDKEALHVYTQDEIDTATKTAIDGLLEASGDIRAQYFTAEEYQAYMNDSSGNYVGIGVTLQLGSDGRPTVARVFKNSPAAEAGVQPGDVILAIDGVRADWTVEDAVNTIRRPEGQAVTVIWERVGAEVATTMNVRTVQREIVTTQLISYQGHQVGYILLEQFTTNSATAVRSAINDLTAAGADSFILDLRDNPGGLLNQAIAIISLFVPSGVAVSIADRNTTENQYVSGNVATDKPLVVLINGGSASASELVTAALQDYNRATVVGEQSYGKGTVQDIRELSFGGAIKFTIAHYLSPKGRSIDGVGVTPDIVVDDGITSNNADFIHQMENGEIDPAQLENTDNGAVAIQPPYPGDSNYTYIAGHDVQLDAALKAIAGN